MFKTASNPRYLILAEKLRDDITSGEYKPGDRLPSESELCAIHGVSRGTVVKAIEQLVAEGAVHRRQGAGSFVARPSLHRRAGNLLSFSESAASEGLRSTQSLITIDDATSEQIREFHCDGPAIYLRRLRLLDGLPCAIHSSIIPQAIARYVNALSGHGVDELERPDFSLYAAFGASGHEVREAQERVTTRLASSEECEVLEITDPSPVMVVFRRSYDAGGRMVEAVEAVYHGEYYTFDFRLVASPTASNAQDNSKLYSLGGRFRHPEIKTGSK